MKIIRTEIEINAPLSLVWQLVVDLAGYNVWNPFLTYVRGEAKEGASVEFHVNLPGAQTTPTRVRISQILPGSKIVWVGHFLNIPGLIDGEHGLEFIQLGAAQPCGAVELETLDDTEEEVLAALEETEKEILITTHLMFVLEK
jgi:hypothetical protein